MVYRNWEWNVHGVVENIMIVDSGDGDGDGDENDDDVRLGGLRCMQIGVDVLIFE